MAFLIVAASLVIAFVVVHVVVGWFLANGLRDRMLLVVDRPSELGVYVRRIGRTTITLEAETPRQDIGHPGRLGIAWDGGRGEIGDVSEVTGTEFVREFRMLTGDPPDVCVGPLAECRPVELDPWVFPGDPGDVGLGFDTVTYDSNLGPMRAWLVRGGSGSRWAIHVHGWTAEKRELIRLLPGFHRTGFTSMVVDYRNDPGAPRDPTGYHRFGLTEWEDVAAALTFALDHGATEIVLVGCSTGAAIVMTLLEHGRDTDAIRGLVFDSPNLALTEAVRNGTGELRATRLMVEFGMWIADLRWKIDWEATNHVDQAALHVTVPTLVFHGTSDRTVPIAVSRQFAARVPDRVELIETPAAGHVMSWNANPARYERYLERFLEGL